MVLSKNDKEEALGICLKFQKKKGSNTVFSNVSKSIFLRTLFDLVNSNGEQIFQSKNTCGIASLMHLSCSIDVVNFVRFSISLYENGTGKLNAYIINENENVKFWANTIKPQGKFNGVSLVVIGAIRFVENSSLRFNKGTMDGMTWPNEIKKISDIIFKKKLMRENSLLLGWNIIDLQSKLDNERYIILLFRTSAWRTAGNFLKDSWHYIVVKNISLDKKNIIDLSYWDYGVEKMIRLTYFQFYSSVVKTFVFSDRKV